MIVSHEIVRWNGLEFVIRSDSIDRANLEWMAGSPFWKAFQDSSISHGDVVLDLGAHIGSFAVLAAARRPCKVFAFEPDPSSFTLCKVNVLLNSVENSLICHPFAVGGTTGPQLLYEATESWAHTIVQGSGLGNILTGEKKQVSCLSLKDALRYANCDRCAFLKFNIEGAEFDMIEKADADTLYRIERMVGEIHMYIAHQNIENIFSKLRNLGFMITVFRQDVETALIYACQRGFL